MSPLISVDDKNWSEVENINVYAIFMGYLLMGVRGLGLLVLTWTTVVLLGGFVTMLQKKDFWCLTVITLVQTAGVFDFLLKEKASDIVESLKGLAVAVYFTVSRAFKKAKGKSVSETTYEEPSNARVSLAAVLLLAQLLVLATIISPVAVLYVLGLYISAGISLWRLIQHDYGGNNNADDGSLNLEPALNVLYFLAVAQGVAYGYRTIYDWAARAELVEEVSRYYSLEEDLVSAYLDETVRGCMKDPSFARGRNLVTYAVDFLMESRSRDGHLPGVKILGTILMEQTSRYFQQMVLMDRLLARSASLSHVAEELALTFGPRSPYSREIRGHAARVFWHIASSISLEQHFHGGGMILRCVSSLLGTFEESQWRPWWQGCESKEYEREWLLEKYEQKYIKEAGPSPAAAAAAAEEDDSTGSSDDNNKKSLQGYTGLVVQGLRILQKLAVDEDNVRVIRNTQGLLRKTMAHLLSEPKSAESSQQQAHRKKHTVEGWGTVAGESLELMKRLSATLGEIPVGEISGGGSKAIISTLHGILESSQWTLLLKRQAMVVLLQLSSSSPSRNILSCGGSSSSSSRTILMGILVHIYLVPDYCFGWMLGSQSFVDYVRWFRRLARENLLQAIPSSSTQTDESSISATDMLDRAVRDVIRSLAAAAADSDNNTPTNSRLEASGILVDLCYYYILSKEDVCLKELKEAMKHVMPKVLKEIVCLTKRVENVQAAVTTEANKGGVQIPAGGPDLEQGGGGGGDNGEGNSSSSHQQNSKQHRRDSTLLRGLIKVCHAIRSSWIGIDQDLTRELNEIAARVCSEQGMPHHTFESLVNEAFRRFLEAVPEYQIDDS